MWKSDSFQSTFTTYMIYNGVWKIITDYKIFNKKNKKNIVFNRMILFNTYKNTISDI